MTQWRIWRRPPAFFSEHFFGRPIFGASKKKFAEISAPARKIGQATQQLNGIHCASLICFTQMSSCNDADKAAAVAAFYREYALERGRVLTAAARARMSLAELVRAVFEHERCSPLEKYLATQYERLVGVLHTKAFLVHVEAQGCAVLIHTLEQLDRGSRCAQPNMDPDCTSFPDLFWTWCDFKTLTGLLEDAKASTCADCKKLWLAAESGKACWPFGEKEVNALRAIAVAF